MVFRLLPLCFFFCALFLLFLHELSLFFLLQGGKPAVHLGADLLLRHAFILHFKIFFNGNAAYVALLVGYLNALFEHDGVYDQIYARKTQIQRAAPVGTHGRKGAHLQLERYKYKERGLVILDFPCNQFGQRAPEAIGKINEFCSANYATTFQRFDKVLVNGKYATPLFVYLKKKLGFRGFGSSESGTRLHAMLREQNSDYAKTNDVKWNFTKFLVNRKGRPVLRFEPTADIDAVEAAIVRLL